MEKKEGETDEGRVEEVGGGGAGRVREQGDLGSRLKPDQGG